MIEVVASIGAYHQNYVKAAMDEIQNKGWEVIRIKKVQRDWIFFGKDVTHIHFHYKKIRSVGQPKTD